jgi:phosphate transport system substrate-binding protein
MKKLIFCALTATLVFCGISAHAKEDVIRLAGSSTAYREIVAPSLTGLKSEGLIIKEDIRGTGPGFVALVSDQADAMLSSATLDGAINAAKESGWKQPEDFDAGVFKQIKLFEDPVEVIINGKNSVKTLSREQVVQIFTGKVRSWKDVGGEDTPIIVVVPQKGRATREVFQRDILGGAAFAEGAIDVDATAKVVPFVRRNVDAIGVTSDIFISGGKIRRITAAQINRPLMLITKGEPSDSVTKLKDYLLGKGRLHWDESLKIDTWLLFRPD